MAQLGMQVMGLCLLLGVPSPGHGVMVLETPGQVAGAHAGQQ